MSPAPTHAPQAPACDFDLGFRREPKTPPEHLGGDVGFDTLHLVWDV